MLYRAALLLAVLLLIALPLATIAGPGGAPARVQTPQGDAAPGALRRR